MNIVTWVPSHRDIQGNKSVDSAAKAATNLPRIKPSFLPTESDLRKHITNHWISRWQKQAPSDKLVQFGELVGGALDTLYS